jgi:hypothetical protein
MGLAGKRTGAAGQRLPVGRLMELCGATTAVINVKVAGVARLSAGDSFLEEVLGLLFGAHNGPTGCYCRRGLVVGEELEMDELTISSANAERIYALLPSDIDVTSRTPITWREALRRGQHGRMLGEITSEGGAEQLPVGVRVRAVGLVIGGRTTIRWLDPNTAGKALPGVSHDYLLCDGDEPAELRSGWLLRTGEVVDVT